MPCRNYTPRWRIDLRGHKGATAAASNGCRRLQRDPFDYAQGRQLHPVFRNLKDRLATRVKVGG
jgi:hypothetical protein